MPIPSHLPATADPRFGNVLLTRTALEVCGGVAALRRSGVRWPYDVAVADLRCAGYLPEHVAAMETLPPEALFFYPDGSVQFCAYRFHDPTTNSYEALLEGVYWGKSVRSGVDDPLVDRRCILFCSAAINRRVYGQEEMMVHPFSEAISDPGNLGLSVIFQRRFLHEAVIKEFGQVLRGWQASAGQVAALSTCTVAVAESQLCIWENLAHFRLALHDADMNVLTWLLVCLLNHSLEGGRSKAVDSVWYNSNAEGVRERAQVGGKEARFDLASGQFEREFPLPRRTGAKKFAGVGESHPTLRSERFPVLVDGLYSEESVQLTLHFEEWPTRDQKKTLIELFAAWTTVNTYKGFEAGAIKWWSELKFTRKQNSAHVQIDFGESTDASWEALVRMLESFDEEAGLLVALVFSEPRTEGSGMEG